MTSQAAQHQQLRAAQKPAESRDRALRLLAQTHSRRYLDDCLRVLQSKAVIATLDARHRQPLREKCRYYYDHPSRDKAGLLRESITRLLVHIAHPVDADLYQRGLATYCRQPVDDVAQNLRAAALAGLAAADPPLACRYAAKFIGESDTSVFNCEPAMTAIAVLVQADQRLPIYQFLLRGGEAMAQSGRGELVGRALESLGADFPPPLYAELMARYQALDQPPVSLGIINWVVEQRVSALYERLETLILGTRAPELRRFGLVMFAAAGDDELSERLLRLADTAHHSDLPLFIEAVELCRHPRRQSALKRLCARLR